LREEKLKGLVTINSDGVTREWVVGMGFPSSNRHRLGEKKGHPSTKPCSRNCKHSLGLTSNNSKKLRLWDDHKNKEELEVVVVAMEAVWERRQKIWNFCLKNVRFGVFMHFKVHSVCNDTV